MIHVKRPPGLPELDLFTEKNKKSLDGETAVSRAERETERAIAFYTDPEHYQNEQKLTKKKFSFSVYNDSRVVTELTRIFRKKCAYCESRFDAVAPQDIEHFRPKSEIDTGNGADPLKPGYYWLAATWDNLLLSCIFCNRSQKHETPDATGKVKMGKLAQFPLADETQRVRHHDDDLSREESVRLLLNPCLDADTEQHLRFTEDGLIRPARIDGAPSAKAEASIRVYALQRKGLVDARQAEALELTLQFQTVADTAFDLKEAIEDQEPSKIRRKERQLGRELDRLRARMAPTAPYLALKRQLVQIAQRDGELDDLVALGMDPNDLLDVSG
ncbi:MAG: hypothetical protein AAF560_14845 [Acidobacteriota bacterium]